jgi:hypothetical protein
MPRRSRPRISPLKVANAADGEITDNDKVKGREENVKKESDEDEIIEEPKEFLSPMKRALLLLVFMLICFFVVWQLGPFERVINAVLPDLNETLHFNRTNASAWIESANPTYKIAFAFQQCHKNATECCNGLEEICDLRVNEIMFATLHKGTAAKEDGSFLNPNHLFSLESALNAGYRGLHLQVCNCDGVYEFCNGICHLGARNPTEVFLNIDRFLRDHPREVLLLKIELNSQVNQKVQLDKLYEIMSNSTKLVDKLYVHKRNEGRENNEEKQWPTLGSMIRSNKVRWCIVLVGHFD